MPKDAKSVRFSMSGTMGFGKFEELVECAKTIEEFGFSSYFASDHMLGVSAMPVDIPAMEPWTLISALAPVTKRLRLGVLVSGVTYRHPSMLAKIASSLDVISKGRLVLGVGSAWSKNDHEAFGIDFPPLKERQQRLREAVEILDGLFTRPSFSYKGQYYRLKDAVCVPAPVQKPRPPLLLAAVGDAGIEIAARHAQIWCAVVTPAYAKDCVDRLVAKTREIGRNPDEIECAQFSRVTLSDDAAEIKRTKAALVAQLSSRGPTAFAQTRNSMPGESLEARIGASLLIGSASEIREQIHRYVAVGVTHIILSTPRPFDRRLLEKFRKDVMSAFIGN